MVQMDVRTDGRTHAHTLKCHSDDYVSLNTSGLDKEN